MDVTRRHALGLIGLAGSGLFFLKEQPVVKRLDPDVIPTGFQVIDEALGGGLRRGSLNVIIGCTGTGKSVFARTIALNAAYNMRNPSSVLYQPECKPKYKVIKRNQPKKRMSGQLIPFPSQHPFTGKCIRRSCDFHDLIISETLISNAIESQLHLMPKSPYGHLAKATSSITRSLNMQAAETNCCLVVCFTTTRAIKPKDEIGIFQTPTPLAYSASTIFSLGDGKISIAKNRYGPNNIKVPVSITPQRTFREA